MRNSPHPSPSAPLAVPPTAGSRPKAGDPVWKRDSRTRERETFGQFHLLWGNAPTARDCTLVKHMLHHLLVMSEHL